MIVAGALGVDIALDGALGSRRRLLREGVPARPAPFPGRFKRPGMHSTGGRSSRRLITGIGSGAMAPIVQSMPLRHQPSTDILAVDGASGHASTVLVLLDLDAGYRPPAYPVPQRLTGGPATRIPLPLTPAGLLLFRRIHAPKPDPHAIERQGVAINNHGHRDAGFNSRASIASAKHDDRDDRAQSFCTSSLRLSGPRNPNAHH